MVNEPYGGYDRYLLLDASFEEENLQAIQVAIHGANDDAPADGSHVLPGIWQVTLGMDRETSASELSFLLADATKANDNVESFMAQVEESIGDMSRLRPNRPVGESCGGFG